MAQYTTPGVYIVDNNAFPNAVVEVETAVPAFIGYTEIACDGSVPKQNVPTYIESLADYVRMFGGPSKAVFTLTQSDDKSRYVVTQDPASRFFLYYAVCLYFANGGGPAYVLSIGNYRDAIQNGKKAADFVSAPDPADPAALSPLDALKNVLDVTLLVAPDTVLLDGAASCYGFWRAALAHCGTMQNRVALIDIFNGDQARTLSADSDVISADETGFRSLIGTDFLSYGAAYYPWLNCAVVDNGTMTYANLTSDSVAVLRQALKDELGAQAGDQLSNSIDTITDVTGIHNQLSSVSPLYRRMCADMLERVNLLPPCGAIAGVYARVDGNQGVFTAPANTTVDLAVTPAVDISTEEQSDLNTPLDGRAVNAIRTFAGRGLVIWGARTLDGNSAAWRYINVRRTAIMLEQSIKAAAMAYVFAPNVSTTWSTVENIISTFLDAQWRAGALQGSQAQDAYAVSVGLGSTMTGGDVLDGYMRVTIKVAISHPGEFIDMTFQQQMPTS
jgi:uncharacterized protein